MAITTVLADVLITICYLTLIEEYQRKYQLI